MSLNAWKCGLWGVGMLLLALLALQAPGVSLAQQGGAGFQRERLAVLPLSGKSVEAGIAEAANVKLREEAIRTGFFDLVEESAVARAMREGGLEEEGCDGGKCAQAIGLATSASLVLSGRMVQVSSEIWQVSAILTDAGSGEVLRAESTFHRGDAVSMLSGAMPQLVDRLIPPGDPAKQGGVMAMLRQAAPGAAGGQRQRPDDGTAQGPATFDPGGSFWRGFGSPIASFSFHFRDENGNAVESMYGGGILAGVEMEVERSMAFGASLSAGRMALRDDHLAVPKVEGEEIDGSFRGFALSALDAVPNGRPWFYYGTGLAGYSASYTHGGQNQFFEIYYLPLFLRGIYTFDTGFNLGYQYQFNLITLSYQSSRMEQLEATGLTLARPVVGEGTIFFGFPF